MNQSSRCDSGLATSSSSTPSPPPQSPPHETRPPNEIVPNETRAERNAHQNELPVGTDMKRAPNEMRAERNARRTKCSPNWAPKRIAHQNRSHAEMEKSLRCGLEEDGTHVFFCNRNRFRLLLHPSPGLKNYPIKRKCERMSIRRWFWP